MNYAITVHNGTALHLVAGEMPTSFVREVTTLCHRTVKPLNFFHDLTDYIQSYNINGKLCAVCQKRNEGEC